MRVCRLTSAAPRRNDGVAVVTPACDGECALSVADAFLDGAALFVDPPALCLEALEAGLRDLRVGDGAANWLPAPQAGTGAAAAAARRAAMVSDLRAHLVQQAAVAGDAREGVGDPPREVLAATQRASSRRCRARC
jgi:hypothetical protein